MVYHLKTFSLQELDQTWLLYQSSQKRCLAGTKRDTTPRSVNASADMAAELADRPRECAGCKARRRAHEARLRPKRGIRRRLGVVLSAALLSGRATSAASAVAASPCAPTTLLAERRRCHQRLHRCDAAFVSGVEPVRWWPRRSRPSFVGGTGTEREVTYASEQQRHHFNSEHATMPPSLTAVMVAAGGQGSTSLPDVSSRDDGWKHLGQEKRQSGRIVSPSKVRAARRALTAARTAAAGKNAKRVGVAGIASAVEQPTWTPRQEGQGSWDKRKAKAAVVETPVWHVDLSRGVCTGDIKVSQVSVTGKRRKRSGKGKVMKLAFMFHCIA